MLRFQLELKTCYVICSHCECFVSSLVNLPVLCDLTSQLWLLLSTIRQTQKEAFNCSSALENFLQNEKGSRNIICPSLYSELWYPRHRAPGSHWSVQYRIAKLATDSQLGQLAPRHWGLHFLPFLLVPSCLHCDNTRTCDRTVVHCCNPQHLALPLFRAGMWYNFENYWIKIVVFWYIVDIIWL